MIIMSDSLEPDLGNLGRLSRGKRGAGFEPLTQPVGGFSRDGKAGAMKQSVEYGGVLHYLQRSFDTFHFSLWPPVSKPSCPGQWVLLDCLFLDSLPESRFVHS